MTIVSEYARVCVRSVQRRITLGEKLLSELGKEEHGKETHIITKEQQRNSKRKKKAHTHIDDGKNAQ